MIDVNTMVDRLERMANAEDWIDPEIIPEAAAFIKKQNAVIVDNIAAIDEANALIRSQQNEIAVLRKAISWTHGRDTGLSSQAILAHMSTGTSNGNYPLDASDLGRCLRLLEIFPEWKNQIEEMSAYGPTWANLSRTWKTLTKSMVDEVGLHWEKGNSAPKTYALMKKCQSSTGGVVAAGGSEA